MKTPRVFILTVFLLCASLILTGCDTGGNGGGGGGGGKAGNKTINVSGGDGDTGVGGDAGGLLIDSYANITVKKGGSADAGFTMPAFFPEYTKCANEYAPTSSVTLAPYDSGDSLPEQGAVYLYSNAGELKYDSDFDGIAEFSDGAVNCIDIPSGVTVTFGLNWDYNNADADADHATGADQLRLIGDSDLRVAGTLRVALLNSAASPDTNSGYDSGSLFLSFQNILVTGTGTIDASGKDNASGNGGHGGYIELYAENGNGYPVARLQGKVDCSGGDATGLTGNGGTGCADQDGAGSFSADALYVWSNSRIVNKGLIYTQGGNGENGGDAGEIQFEGTSHVYHTGTIHANGGTGSNGIGGNGSWIGLDTDLGSIFVKGDITANGGDGTGGGGDGADIDLWNFGGNNSSDMLISGDIDISGGNATTSGDGGDGGYLMTDSSGGDIVISGNISASGGNGMDTASTGGSAQYIYLVTNSGNDYNWGNFLPSGAIELSGNLDVSGGEGNSGGNGGNIDIWHANYETDVYPGALDITLYGYSNIRGEGGMSQSGNGGNGGYVEMYTNNTFVLNLERPAGSIITEPNIRLSGGDGGTATGNTGGHGGYIYLIADALNSAFFDESGQQNTVMNSGNIDLSAGSGDIGGSNNSSTYVDMYAYGLSKNTGTINLDSGNGLTDGGNNNAGISITSSRDVINTGRISSNAGNGTSGDGGYASSVYLSLFAGRNVKNAGGIYTRGGNGNTTSGTGGDGGMIDILSQQTTTVNSASLSVAGGKALNEGLNGIIWIDWTDITPADGTL